MKTKLFKINPRKIEIDKIRKAAQIIKKGGLVAFPTETVYGLGADAFNKQAITKIFRVKKRPFNDPLIVHIADKKDVFKVADKIDKTVCKIIEQFWPGPLTVILKKAKDIPKIATANLETIAIRMPAHSVALSLIKEAKTPLVAPSANLFGKLSPTTAEDVLEDLRGKIDLVLDAGKTVVGIESTILDLTRRPFSVLRFGGVSLEELKRVIPEFRLYKEKEILAPGMFIRHYSPRAKLIVVEEGKGQIGKVKKMVYKFLRERKKVGIMAKAEHRSQYRNFKVKFLGRGNDFSSCASNLFALLREFDREKFEIIIAEGVKEKGLGRAIMERLRKAQGDG
ncbi:MAG: L-threonylcarbamoyladenylate synthase [Candidatus Omnitrophica bacterium]|nr:L-threonylcarbamoyladenylate synthase [Candidatus Omnitrophota bacterium]